MPDTNIKETNNIADGGYLLVTRPALAALLRKAGCKGEIVPHPWVDGLSCWLFTVDDTVCEIAIPFYKKTGKRIPACLRKGRREARE